MAYIANIAFACKLVNEKNILEGIHTVFEIGGNNIYIYTYILLNKLTDIDMNNKYLAR